MTSLVHFKVYLLHQEDPDKQEIRRFGIDQDVVTNFLYLREKIINVFPTLRGRHFTISWKDEDKDDIVISSDEEWSITLSETADDLVRKLYVFVYSEYPKDYPNTSRGTSGAIHEGVICDGCEKQIQGFRYKCLQCIDYDLCVNCDARGIHEDHCMLRLVVPSQWKPHWGRKIAGLMNRSMRKTANAADDDKELKFSFTRNNSCKEERREKNTSRNKDNHHGNDKDKHYGKQHKRRCNDNNGVSWTNTLASYLNDWANVPGECPIIDKVNQEVTKQAAAAASSASAAAGVAAGVASAAAASVADLSGAIPKKNQTAAATTATATATAPPPPEEPSMEIPKPESTDENKKSNDKKNDKQKNEKKNPMDPYMELLKMVGENFTPFIETFVNPQPTSSMSHIQKAAADAAAAAVASHFNVQPNPYGFKQDNTKSQDNEQTKADNKSSENITPMDTDKNNNINVETTAADKSSDNEDWTIIGANANSSTSVDVDSNKAIPLPYKSTDEKASTSNGLYPKLPQIEKVQEPKEKIIYHADKNIQQAIETMMEMGFTNEGGWLTNLLVSKDGDIDRALDTLSPVRR